MDKTHDIDIAITISVTTFFAPPGPEAALHREATVLKESGDWAGAINKLELAKGHMLASTVRHGHQMWCRLAKFYQYAGRYDESMAEFDFLVTDLKRRIYGEYFVDDPSVSYGKESKRLLASRTLRRERAAIESERKIVQARELRWLKKATSKSMPRASKKTL